MLIGYSIFRSVTDFISEGDLCNHLHDTADRFVGVDRFADKGLKMRIVLTLGDYVCRLILGNVENEEMLQRFLENDENFNQLNKRERCAVLAIGYVMVKSLGGNLSFVEKPLALLERHIAECPEVAQAFAGPRFDDVYMWQLYPKPLCSFYIAPDPTKKEDGNLLDNESATNLILELDQLRRENAELKAKLAAVNIQQPVAVEESEENVEHIRLSKLIPDEKILNKTIEGLKVVNDADGLVRFVLKPLVDNEILTKVEISDNDNLQLFLTFTSIGKRDGDGGSITNIRRKIRQYIKD